MKLKIFGYTITIEKTPKPIWHIYTAEIELDRLLASTKNKIVPESLTASKSGKKNKKKSTLKKSKR